LISSDENNPNKVIVKKLALCVADRPDMELDLSGDVTNLKKQVIVLTKYIFQCVKNIFKF